MKGEPPHPRAELLIAIAGPLSSFVLALFFFIINAFVTDSVAKALFSYLVQLNVVLGVFNLIPGFPMDGGRVVRASLWKKTNDFFYATRRASRYGQNIALFFIVFGLLSLFAGFPGALWLMIIGWFLHTAAHASYQQASLQETLSGIKVRDIMVEDVVTISSGESVERVVNGYFLRYGYGGFPVMDGENLIGIVTLKDIKNVPKEQWRDTKVSRIAVPHQKRWEVSPDDDALKALEIMINEEKGRLLVTEKERVVGLITRNGITGYIQIMGR
jgi:CBS domain-containing protein